MKQKRILSDYSLSDYPELILDVIEKRVKLTAVIQQQPDLYFLPETVLDSDELNTFEVLQELNPLNMSQPAVTGNYEMTDNSWIVKELQLLQENCLHSKSLVLKGLKSPDGVIGYFRTAKRHGRWEPELARIELTLIYVEDIHSSDSSNEHQISTREERDRLDGEPAAKERNAYLRLIGYMALKLQKLDKLPIDVPNKAGGIIEKDAKDLGYEIGREESIGQKLEAASKMLKESRIPKSDSK